MEMKCSKTASFFLGSDGLMNLKIVFGFKGKSWWAFDQLKEILVIYDWMEKEMISDVSCLGLGGTWNDVYKFLIVAR